MKIIAGNWKMNGTRTALSEMINALQNIDTQNTIILCVPYTLLNIDSGRIALGAQDTSTHDHGAYTGEVSAQMIAETGAKYVIVGHSERRQYHGETNNIVQQKAAAAMTAGLIPIICIGETMNEKQSGIAMQVIESGVRECVPPNTNKNIIIAYEPRWAIGAGITPTDDEIAAAHKLIADTLSNMCLTNIPILYGASVKATNAAQIMSIPNVDGVLVGGASLKPDDFIPIITNVK